MLKILIFTQYYSPDFASTGQLVTDLAESLAVKMNVTVIASMPSYSSQRAIKALPIEVLNGVHIQRFPIRKANKKKKISRVLNLFSYYFGAKRVARKIHSSFDLVFCLSQPQLLGGVIGRWGKRHFHSKLIYNIQDFFPESAVALGMIHSHFLADYLLRIDCKNCRDSDIVITVGRDLVSTLKKRFLNSEAPNILMINNWANDDQIYPLEKESDNVSAARDKFGFSDKFVFMYSGNIGLFYDLPNLILALCRLPKHLETPGGKKVVFAFFGDGVVLPKLQSIVKDQKMDNVVFLPYQDKNELIYTLNCADVHFCFSADGFKGVSCPSKYYGIAAVAKPVVAVLEKGSEIRMLIEETHGGLVSSPCDYSAFVKNVMWFVENADGAIEKLMGENAYHYLKENLSKKKSLEKYEMAIKSLFIQNSGQ